MQSSRYDYSSVHVDVPLPVSKDIVEWGRANVIDDDIYVSQKDPGFGREDEMHVTILYGIHTDKSEVVKEIIEKQGPVRVTLNKIGVFTNPFKFDVVMIQCISDDLKRLNEKLENSVKFTNKYKHYQPHVTIAYVKKGKGWKHHGIDLWQGKEFQCDYAVFSSKNGGKEKIIL